MSSPITRKSKAVLEGQSVNYSYCTVGTETTSFSEDGDEQEQDACDEPFSTGVFRFDDLMSDADENDSLSVAAIPTNSLAGAVSEHSIHDFFPREIVVLDDDALEADDPSQDIDERLRVARALAMSYKAQLQSTEEITDYLHEHLKQAQNYAEDVLADRNDLLHEIEELQDPNCSFCYDPRFCFFLIEHRPPPEKL